jgi:ClpP class serine protease
MKAENQILKSFSYISHLGAVAFREKCEIAKTICERTPKAGLLEELSKYFPSRNQTTIDQNGIAHVHVFGEMAFGLSDLEKALGMTDTGELADEIEALQTEARGILLHGGSPGGSVIGGIELGETVARSQIPVVAFSDTGFFSLGYMTVAGADMIIGTRSSSWGNIGTVIPFADVSEFWQKQGVRFDAISNEGADLKKTGYESRFSESQLAFLQERANESGKEFQEFVLRNRQLVDQSDTFRGGWFSGPESARRGLIDFIATKQDAYDSLIGLTQRKK